MWTSLLKILDGVLALSNGLLAYFSQAELRRQGAIEEHAKSQEKTLERVKVANEIKALPTPADKSSILIRL